MKKYDYLVVGAGLFGAVFSYEAARRGKKIKVLEKRNHLGGNAYTKEVNGIQVHQYGPHIFHTNKKEIWAYVNRFSEFHHFLNCPLASFKGEMYPLPFNMNTFCKLWGEMTPEEALAKIEKQRAILQGKVPKNLEEQAIFLAGTDIYEKLIKGYTEKQWGRPCTALPPSIINRLPVRFTFDNRYFTDEFQGIPMDGYTKMMERMLDSPHIDITLSADFLEKREEYEALSEKIIYTGTIDRFFAYSLGKLEYRSLRFEEEILPVADYQKNAVVNYTDSETPYTRIVEHKHFLPVTQQKETVITKEYPMEWENEGEPYYPINNEKNNALFQDYRKLAEKNRQVIFGGRLGTYQYLNMDTVIEEAIICAQKECSS